MRSRRRIALWAAAVAYAVAIFLLSSQPVPAPGEEVLAVIGDKALHAAEYVGFAVLLALAIATAPSPWVRSRSALIALAGAVAYAATDEFHQTFVAGRQGSILDFGADAAGAAIATAAYQAWRWWTSRTPPLSDTSPR